MSSDMDDYVYDPTRRFYRLYDSYVGFFVMAGCYFASFFMVIATLGIIFGDHNLSGALILLVITCFFLFMATASINCNSKSVRRKREVYTQYRSMSKEDRKQYVSTIRSIHRDDNGEESIPYKDLIKLFKMKSLNNSASIEFERQRIKQDLDTAKLVRDLQDSSHNEIKKINSNFDL